MKALGILILLIFYSIYIGKIILQKRKGISIMVVIGDILFGIAVITMLHLQIKQEEIYLQDRFNNDDLTYKNKVCRYLGRK